MPDHAWRVFELRRESDDFVYTFIQKIHPDGTVGYQRQDGNVWIAYRPEWGWVS